MKRLIIFIMCILLLTGCGGAEETASATVFAMDTVMNLETGGLNANRAVEEMTAEINNLNVLLSATDERSLIHNSGHHELFVKVEALSERTNGAFDPKLHAVMEAWGFPTKAYRIPTQGELEAALAEDAWDLGGIAKGYTADRCVDILDRLNVNRALLDLGGNVQTYGTKADGTPWRIGIDNPSGDGYLGVISVEGTKAVVTSGDYQRYFEENGIRYHHILDPETGASADSGLRSVTVICDSGTTADALSTALFVMGLEEGAKFWRSSDDFEAVFVTADGKIYATEGAGLSDCAFEVIAR